MKQMLRSSSSMAKYHRYHVRSTSLPSTPHPLTAGVEEQIEKTRSWLASSSSWSAASSSSCSSQTHQSVDILQGGLCSFIGLYDSVEDLLQLPHIQQILVQHKNEKWVDKMLDGSLRLLDVTSTSRDVLLQMKEGVRETQLALRRTRGSELSGNLKQHETNSFMSYGKKLSKHIQKCVGDLRKMEEKSSLMSCTVSDEEDDEEFVAIACVLRNVEFVSVSVLESLLSFTSTSSSTVEGKPRSSRWSLVSKLVQKRRIACEEQQKINGGSSTRDRKEVMSSSSVHHQNAQKHLQELESSIRGLEEGLERAFRRLIKTRVCLLNILSN